MNSKMIVAVVVGGLALGPGSSSAQDRVEWRDALEPGQTLRVAGISGRVSATPAEGSRAEIVAEKRGRQRDFDDVRIVIDEDQDGVVVCTVYGDSDRDSCDGERWGGNEDGHGRRRGGSRRSINVSVDFEIRVPAGVDLEINMVTGDIRVDDLRSDVFANTVTGDIRIETSEIAEAQTVSGSIDVWMGSDEFEDLSFQTVSGDIRLWLPESADADVRFSSLSGDLDTELPLTISRRSGGRVGSSVEGSLGQGGPRLSLQTVSGDVELNRLR